MYIQDKFEREGVIVNGGLRFDHINVDTPALRNDFAPLENGPFPDSLDKQDLSTNRTYARLSPRLGVSFPVDEKTQLRFNFGQFYQQPNLQDLYVSYRFLEYKLQTGGYYVGFGNPNLRPERTTAYEAGFARLLTDRMRVDVTAYYKDVKDLVEVTTIPTAPGALSKQFASFRNRDFATIKGVDVGMTMRRTNHFSGNLSYSLSFAKGTGSVSNTQRNIAWTASDPPRQTAPLDFDQRHKISANVDWSLEKDQSSQIDFMLPPQAAAGNLAATAIADKLTPPGSSGRQGASARRDWLESLFSARFLFARMELRGPTLVGWLEQAPNQITAPDFRLSSADFTLLVQPLQPQLPFGFEGEVPAAAMNRRDLGIGSGAPTDRDYYTVAPGEAITLQFMIPPSEGTFQLRQLRLNIEGVVQGRVRQANLPFTVSLFNWRAAEWQAWEVGPGSSIVPDGERYISATGDVRLRYLLDASLSSTVREVRLNRLDVTAVGAIR